MSSERCGLRRIELMKKIELVGGTLCLNKAELAREFGVSETQIKKDLHKLGKRIPKEKVDLIAGELFNMHLRALKDVQLKFDDPRKVDKLNTVRESTTKLLHDFGIKEKIADEMNVNVVDVNDILNRVKNNKKWMTELKNLKDLKKQSVIQ